MNVDDVGTMALAVSHGMGAGGQGAFD